MKALPHPRQEERLAALRDLGILDTPRERSYDKIVELVADLCDAPIAVVNLIDERRQWFKAEIGLGVRETPLDTSICSHIILQRGLSIIPDTLSDPRTCDNELCIGTKNLRFYAGVALETDDGLPIGTLCIFDHRPRELSEQQKKTLIVMAEQVTVQMRLNQKLAESLALRQEVDHRIKNSLGIVRSILSLQSRQSATADTKQALAKAADRINAIASLHEHLQTSNSKHEVQVATFLERLVSSLSEQILPGVKFAVTMPAVFIKSQEASSIGLIVNELVTNALKHGIQTHGQPRVEIHGTIDANKLRIAVRNNGKPLPTNFSLTDGSGLGMRLSSALAVALGGVLAWESSDAGTQISFDVPLSLGDRGKPS